MAVRGCQYHRSITLTETLWLSLRASVAITAMYTYTKGASQGVS